MYVQARLTYIAKFEFYPWLHVCICMLSTLSITTHACCDWLAVKCTRFVGSMVGSPCSLCKLGRYGCISLVNFIDMNDPLYKPT